MIDNAIRHNIPSGQIEISTGPAAPGAGARLSVRNTGPVIPPVAVDTLFEPFRQYAQARIHTGNGYGLGLAIVRAIATAHQATVKAHSRPEGGLDIQVIYPPAGPAAH